VNAVVLDTNIVLDLFVFKDPATGPLWQGLQSGQLRWIATMDMRAELERVLGYKHIVPRLAFYALPAQHVLALFDQHACIEPVAIKASAVCKDPDDQRFIDLAVAHRALLLSKDKAVLCMKKRLLALGSIVKSAI